MENSTKRNEIITRYYNSVCDSYRLGNIESSYYSPIMSLFTEIGCAARDLSGERRGQTGENIDIKLWHSEDEVAELEPFAGIEVKKIGGIDNRALAQIRTEAKQFGNAILTDNCEWRFYRSGDENMYTGLRIIDIKDSKPVLLSENIELFFSLLEDFFLQSPSQIKSSSKLAEYMAIHARTIRSIVKGILRDDGKGKPVKNDSQERVPMFPELYGLFNRIKTDLRPAMGTREFADMYAQTIVYGLFIARYNDKSLDNFDKYEAIGNLQDESELLKQFFMHIAGGGRKHPTLDGVIEKLCGLYRICDIRAILGSDITQDAIVHFYEKFLSYYDPELRKELGVFYTPVQAVRYMIRLVDKALIEELNIEGGLSNNDRITVKVPCSPYKASPKSSKYLEEKEISVPKVAILDPACGTGSFCAEIINYVKDVYFSGSKEAFYDSYIQSDNSLLSRLIAFEIMMTSYVVAHLKVRRTIDSTLGYTPDNKIPTNIFLTNTLAAPISFLERNEQLHLFDLFDFSAAITNEAYNADTWKARRPVKVIIGNPPYLAASTNPYDISAYKTETDGVTDFKERKHWLNDDYVKFFRFAENIINRNSEGVLAYISNNGYLDNPTFRGMRGSLLRSFDLIYIVNLHGSANKKEVAPDGGKDENIFDIMQGVSLFVGIKKSKSTKWGRVYYSEVFGTREHKLSSLLNNELVFNEITPDSKMAYFIPIDDSNRESYDRGISITELFPMFVTGIVSGRDEIAIAPTREELERRVNIVRNTTSDEQIDKMWGKYCKGQNGEKIRNDVLSDGVLTQIAYRPYDLRWTYYSGNSCGWVFRPREKKTMGHLMTEPTSPVGQNIGLVFCKTSRSFFSPFISNNIIAHRLFSAMCEITYIAPLFLYSDNELMGDSWQANLNEDAYNKLTDKMKEKPTAIDVFDYVYAILHDPSYCKKYDAYLCRDFPRIPMVNDVDRNDEFLITEEMFKEYVSIGSELRKTHLLQKRVYADLILNPNNADNMQIESTKYHNGVVKINPNKAISGIPEDVWNYEVGGYQVVEKWLKERKGKFLTIEMFTHLENIVAAISETINLEKRLEELHL